jgi:hypothetical protein
VNALKKHQEDYLSPAKSANVTFGRFMLPDLSEHTCQVASIDMEGAVFLTNHKPPNGTLIVAYVEDLGRVELLAGNPVPGGFEVHYALNGARLERLKQRIEWLQQKANGAADGRKHARYEPQEKNSQIALPDGRIYPCEVIDISVSGAAIKTEVMPSVGTFVTLGRQRGRVVRYMSDGVGIEFVKQITPGQLPPLAVPVHL